MAITLKDYQSNVFTGLGTFTYNVPAAGLYFFGATTSENPPSGLSIVINQNGSPIASSAAPASAQQVVEVKIYVVCALADVITFVLSSSNANDSVLNDLKTIMICSPGISQGQ